MYVSTPFSSSDSCSSFKPSKTPSGSSESTSPSSSSSSNEFPSGSTSASVTASQSTGEARPLFARIAAFFFACCSTNRSSSATQAASCASATGRFAGTVGRGGIAAVIGWKPWAAVQWRAVKLGSLIASVGEACDYGGEVSDCVSTFDEDAATRRSGKQSSGSRQETPACGSPGSRAVPQSLTLF